MQITIKWSQSKPEVEFQYGRRLFFSSKNEVVISQPNFGSRMQNETPLTEKIVGIETGSRIPTGWTFVFPRRK